MRFRGGGVGHRSTWHATDWFLDDRDKLDEREDVGDEEEELEEQELNEGMEEVKISTGLRKGIEDGDEDEDEEDKDEEDEGKDEEDEDEDEMNDYGYDGIDEIDDSEEENGAEQNGEDSENEIVDDALGAEDGEDDEDDEINDYELWIHAAVHVVSLLVCMQNYFTGFKSVHQPGRVMYTGPNYFMLN